MLIRRHFNLRQSYPSLRQIGVAAERFPTFRNPLHGAELSHDVLYLSFLLRGSVTHRVDGHAAREEAGTVTVVNYGTSHEIVTGRSSADVFNLYLDPQRHPLPHLPSALALHLARLLPLHAGLVSNLNRLVRVILPLPAHTAQWLTGIVHEQGSDAVGAMASLQALLTLVLIDLAQAAATSAPATRLVGDPPLERAAALIESHFARDLTVADLAAAAGLSPWHFTRRFTAWAGRSPMRCLRDRRLQEAMSRLRSSEQRILDLALACGFRDLAHFNRTFKQVAGITPSAYRQRLS